MTECTVTCYPCGADTRPKVWRWLCEDCAREQHARHRADTGHDADLYIAPEVDMPTIRRDMARARKLMRGWPGW